MNRIEFKLTALEKIDKAFDNLQKIENKKEEVKSELKNKFDDQINKMNQKKEELKADYKAIQNASDENWKEIKQTYSESLEHFKAGLNELEQLIK